ncbi:DEAD/DEAH box helicase family protein [Neisseria subflava]|uniref:helicase-related protein n=1 Tax=Neisseria subflava TaxID=28449 RepID=UPI001C999B96|nr:helicase-related protein [Neisseria subflava]MBY6285229.1 DEAD/DEAH box helicase family protein [Neisseria subflava]
MKVIDNINQLLGDDLKENIGLESRISIASSIFSIYAYSYLKEELENIEELRFIFTSPTFVPEQAASQEKKEIREFTIEQNNRENNLYGTEFEIHLKNKLMQKAIAHECAEWIRKKVQFKSNKTSAFMQDLIAVELSPNKAIIYLQSQGFTPVGLGIEQGNAIGNIVSCIDDLPFSQQYLNLFEQIWQDESKLEDVTEEVIRHIESVYEENAPNRIYFLILYNIFKEFLNEINEDVMPNDRTGYQETQVWKKLYNFQKDAAIGIINKLENYNGCILADSVGLGKTFTALAVIKYYELRNKSVLVLCPKKLVANWTNYNANLITNPFAKDRFNYDVLFHTDLSRDSGISNGIDLSKINWSNYDLVVIDESHNFRNRDTFKDRKTRYDRLMDQVIQQGVKTKVLMLSATPVNNRFTDLKNQLALAYEGESGNLESKINTQYDIETIFRRAQAQFNVWSKLPPEKRNTQTILRMLDLDFFKLLDSVTIARSRKHIQTYYDTSSIGTFPTRLKPISYQCGIATDDSIDLNQIYQQLSSIRMSVYAPVNYILPSKQKKYEEKFDTHTGRGGHFTQADRERSLQALMTTNLLKRLESSIHAFRLTLTTIRDQITSVLKRIEDFNKNKTNSEWDIDNNLAVELAEGEEGSSEDYIGKRLKINLTDMDTLSWAQDLQGDLDIVDNLLQAIVYVTSERDAKLQHLKQQIAHKIGHPINKNNRKIIVFTAFADTADYLYQNLAEEMLVTHGIHSAKITGTSNQSTIKTMPNNRAGYDMQGLLTLFSPISKQKADIFPSEQREIDLLIATDCISEGQNLQDCDYLINYDIHWNPVRIIQRFGRIDRIGSQNSVIQLVNYWPDISLDDYIKLRERVESRMVIADMAGTGDDNVLSAQSNDIAYRREQLKRLQEEVLDLEDANGGVSITDLGLNDFRIDLHNYLEANPQIKRLPFGLHAVVPADTELGLLPGVIFALRSRKGQTERNPNNRIHPYFLTYISTDGKIIQNYTEAKHILDVMRKICRPHGEPIPSAYHSFNKRTKDGRNMKHYSDLLEKSVAAIQNRKIESDLDSLFSSHQTTALENDTAGSNDFELIGFIVIEEVSE